MHPILAMLFLSVHISGVVVDHEGDVLKGVSVIARSENAESRTTTDETGRFSLDSPGENLSLSFDGPYIQPFQKTLSSGDRTDNLRIEVDYSIPPIHQSIVITAA